MGRGEVRDERPGYARLLRLRHLRPSGLLCSLFLEGAVALGVLLALAELASWWSIPVLPLTVAAMVKVNDVVAGALRGSKGPGSPSTAAGHADPVGDAGLARAVVPRPAAPMVLRPVVARASVPGGSYARPPVTPPA
jgi:hypothetical protein